MKHKNHKLPDLFEINKFVDSLDLEGKVNLNSDFDTSSDKGKRRADFAEREQAINKKSRLSPGYSSLHQLGLKPGLTAPDKTPVSPMQILIGDPVIYQEKDVDRGRSPTPSHPSRRDLSVYSQISEATKKSHDNETRENSEVTGLEEQINRGRSQIPSQTRSLSRSPSLGNSSDPD